MKKIILTSFLVIFTLVHATEKPQPVLRIVYEQMPDEWYQTQAELWKKELEANPQNAEAWVYYYNANRYRNFENIDTQEKKTVLNKIIQDMQQAIPGTFESYMLAARNVNDINDIAVAQKAFDLRPDDPSTYDLFITYYEVQGQMDKVKEFYQKLYDSRDIAPWLLEYNYNMLMSAEKNAILFTNGDNDTYPARMLQEVHGVRTDVTIINVSMSTIYEYLKRILGQKNIKIKEFKREAVQNGVFSLSEYVRLLTQKLIKDNPEIPINFALTVYPQHTKHFQDNLYVVGLTTQYSADKLDNIALLKRNTRFFRLDNLSYDWYREKKIGRTLRARIYMNYVPGFIMLARHYAVSGDEVEKQKFKDLAFEIARQGDDKKLLETIKEII
ncbi:hypothetical protein JW935_23040 [candidate division KSB1 bacterium]|nr:hypothetical protein [candidate division KSB1 bacterium]